MRTNESMELRRMAKQIAANKQPMRIKCDEFLAEIKKLTDKYDIKSIYYKLNTDELLKFTKEVSGMCDDIQKYVDTLRTYEEIEEEELYEGELDDRNDVAWLVDSLYSIEKLIEELSSVVENRGEDIINYFKNNLKLKV